ncbi:MAG: Gfo/Idh/MocA family oxidoreductase [Tetrasphaera sp.]
MSGPVGVGVIGAGNISAEYLRNLTSFPDLRVLAIADEVADRAAEQARAFGVPHVGGVQELLDDSGIEIVLNLTTPAAHVPVTSALLRSGKHVYSEKALAVDREGGRHLLALAAERGLRLGCAPDTFLGAGLQSAKRLITSGAIGQPLSAITLLQDPGPESWHPSPEFIYAPGAGPLWDRGPYYLTMLVQMLGSIRAVAATTTTAFAERTVQTGPRAGTAFPVEVPTNVTALLEFEGGVTAHSTFSYESPVLRKGWIEITGTEATLAVPDPNSFVGDVFIYPTRRFSFEEFMAAGVEPPRSDWRRVSSPEWTASRGLGVLDLARGLRSGTPHRASGELAFHVLDVMSSIDEAAQAKSFVTLESSAPGAPLLPETWDPYRATL